MKKLSTEPYKGTRDFYPEDMRLQNYIFNTMRKVVQMYGYQEYTASVMEESDLYRAKTGEEIVNEQTFSFTDRGGRDVTLRPEMTPTVARMVAARSRDLPLPVRWYSIPNCFRYERPQRGRLREFWQLNVDIIGTDSVFADAETIEIAYKIMIAFGAKSDAFVIRLNSRKLMNELFKDILGIDEEKSYRLSKLIDKKEKIPQSEFEQESVALVGDKLPILQNFLKAKTLETLPVELAGSPNVKELQIACEALTQRGVSNLMFDPTLMRGFDYYTGIVFEVYDINPINSRSMFGGGRYDNLLDIFGAPAIPAFGFGMGDVTIQNYLETYDLIPNLSGEITLGICIAEDSIIPQAMKLASDLRNKDVSVVVDYSNKKLEKKIKNAIINGVKYLTVLGSKEFERGELVLKEIVLSTEKIVKLDEIVEYLVKVNNPDTL